MEDTRFDDMAKALGSRTSRRLTLSALLGGAIGRLGLDEAEAAKSGKCKPKCDECEKCDKGKCDKKNGKKKCKKGKCKPKAAGTPCTLATGSGGACCNGTCVNIKTDKSNCGACGTRCTDVSSNQVCQEGSCFPTSTCPATTIGLCFDAVPTPCGAPDCICDRSTEGNVFCASFTNVQCPPPVGAGQACTSSADCSEGWACVDISHPACQCAPGAKVCRPKCPAPTIP